MATYFAKWLERYSTMAKYGFMDLLGKKLEYTGPDAPWIAVTFRAPLRTKISRTPFIGLSSMDFRRMPCLWLVFYSRGAKTTLGLVTCLLSYVRRELVRSGNAHWPYSLT